MDLSPVELGTVLWEVQQYDTCILEVRKRIEGLPAKHRLTELAAELSEARQARTDRERELEEIGHRQHKLDGELDLLTSKVKVEEQKLFSGTIMNPKELQAIQAEIFSLRKKRDEMETEDLELMEETDRLAAEAAELKAKVETTESSEALAKSVYEKELEELELEIAGLEGERDARKLKLDEETIAEYEKLLAGKAGLAVVKIQKGASCGGCHIQFSATQIDQYEHGEGVWRCQYCRRMLVK
ncbi:MAG: hypothetical protein KKF41_09595 [Actinobacteria bacterium]|nr:hypothetical protein [Actinomycetota bacterium]MBU1945254.1 hypothetical protein [Actinomycetota bacterium]MBU2687826.1 hypothetical protein [Actinomycetota bacterium]